MDELEKDNENQEAVGTRNNDRLAMLASISDNSEESRLDEFNAEESHEAEKVEDLSQQVNENIQAETPALPKIKVNGKEIELTPEMIERAQKVAAADQYLAEAAKYKREVEQKNSQPSKPDAAQHVEEDDVALARALQMGSEEDAVAAIKAIRNKAPSVNPDEIVLKAKDAIAMDEAVKWFQNEYDFIFKDPYLQKIAVSRDAELLANGDNRPYRERYEAIGKEISDWSGKMSGQKFREKEQKKAEASENVVSIASKKAPPPQVEDEEESTSDVIAGMAKRRGQI